VRAPLVVAGDPPRNDGSGVVEIVEDRLVEQFIAHAAVEGFADAVLHRLAGGDEVPGDAGGLGPGEHGVRGELGPVIGDDEIGLAAPADDLGQFPRHAAARDGRVRDCCQALLRHVVDDVEDAEAPARAELVVDEVDRPARVRPGLDQ
jgi:hypothetical protein